MDFRKSINELLVIIEYALELPPFIDALFIFCNKQQNKLKIIYWDKSGTALGLCALVQSAAINRFKWPTLNDLKHIRLSDQQLQWLLVGFHVIEHRTLNYTCTGL